MQDVIGAALGAGLVAVGVTLAVERFGGRLGGILGTLPTTIVPASLGMWHARPEAYDLAVAGVVVGMVCDTAFLGAWRVVPPRVASLSRSGQAVVTTAAGLGAWGVLALAWTLLTQGSDAPIPGLSGTTLALSALAAQVAIGLGATWHAVPAPRARAPVTAAQIVARGGLAAAAIGLATWIAAVGPPVLAGMVSVFPAIFLTTMLSLFLAHGDTLPAGAAGPMMLGSASVSVYALLSLLTLPALGPVAGASTAWLGAVLLASLPAGAWLRARPPRDHQAR